MWTSFWNLPHREKGIKIEQNNQIFYRHRGLKPRNSIVKE